jgi:hypothetical protein
MRITTLGERLLIRTEQEAWASLHTAERASPGFARDGGGG